MEYKFLGNTGLRVSVLGFGCMTLEKGSDEALNHRLLDQFVAQKIHFFRKSAPRPRSGPRLPRHTPVSASTPACPRVAMLAPPRLALLNFCNSASHSAQPVGMIRALVSGRRPQLCGWKRFLHGGHVSVHRSGSFRAWVFRN